MAGPLTGLGSGQQIPLANTFQPGQNVDQKRIDDTRHQRKDVTLPAGTSAANSQSVETRNAHIARARNATAHQVNDNSKTDSNQRRGSTVDITV